MPIWASNGIFWGLKRLVFLMRNKHFLRFSRIFNSQAVYYTYVTKNHKHFNFALFFRLHSIFILPHLSYKLSLTNTKKRRREKLKGLKKSRSFDFHKSAHYFKALIYFSLQSKTNISYLLNCLSCWLWNLNFSFFHCSSVVLIRISRFCWMPANSVKTTSFVYCLVGLWPLYSFLLCLWVSA